MLYINLGGTEKVIIMKPRTEGTSKNPRIKRRKRRLPEQFICIAQEDAWMVFDWLNGVGLEANQEVAQVHLRLCFHCQEAVAKMMKLDDEFRARAGRSLHLANSTHHQAVTMTYAISNHEAHQVSDGHAMTGENSSRPMEAVGQS